MLCAMDKQMLGRSLVNEVVNQCVDKESIENLVGLFQLLIEIDLEQKSNKPSNDVQNN